MVEEEEGSILEQTRSNKVVEKGSILKETKQHPNQFT